MKAVILAGGFGSRLAEMTDEIPKPMVEIGGIPILVHIMAIYARHGVTDFVICCGYKGHYIKEYFSRFWLNRSDVTFSLAENTHRVLDSKALDWNITLIDTGKESMTGGRLKRVSHLIDDDTFCFTYGDGVADIDIGKTIEFHNSHSGIASMIAVRPPGRFGALALEGTSVKKFIEKPQGDGSFINGGFFVLDKKVFDYIEGDSTVWEKGPLEKMAQDKELFAYRHEGFWQPMDTLRDNRFLNDLWNQGNPPWGPIDV
jgi:glucose-1-phosphate cytidylyltransferase